MGSFYDIPVNAIDGTSDLLGKLRGKELADQNFTVVGFPCNPFGAQEPGTETQIQAFCRTTYDVSFPMSAKLEVNGPGRHPVYALLTGALPGDIQWNFEKFLVGRDGQVLKRYPPISTPQDKSLLQDIADAMSFGKTGLRPFCGQELRFRRQKA